MWLNKEETQNFRRRISLAAVEDSNFVEVISVDSAAGCLLIFLGLVWGLGENCV